MIPARIGFACLASLAAIGGLSAPISHAGPRSRPPLQLVTLGRETVVTATEHTHARLHIPEDVSLTDLRTAVSGGGRVAGFALTNWGDRKQDDDLVLYSFAFNRCGKAGCPPAEDPLPVRVGSGMNNGVVPAGTYDLYVVADEAPVSITFKNRKLGGRSRTALDRTGIEIDLSTLPMSPATTPDGTVFSAGDFTSLEPGRGLGVLGLWAQGSPYAGGAFGSCFYFSDALVADKGAAFLPGCPTGSSAHRYPAPPAAPGEPGGVVYESSYQALPLGIGGWAASGSALTEFGAVGLWIRFADAE